MGAAMIGAAHGVCFDRIGYCDRFGCVCPTIPEHPTKLERELLAAIEAHGPLTRAGILRHTGRDTGYMGAGGLHPVRQAISRLGLRGLAHLSRGADFYTLHAGVE